MTQDRSMWDDPNESSALRKLLRAGRVEQVDYDVERGLARHLANLQAGAPLPPWAAQTAAPKLALTSWAAWLVPPVVSAIALGGWLYASHTETSLPTLSALSQPASVGANGPSVGPSVGNDSAHNGQSGGVAATPPAQQPVQVERSMPDALGESRGVEHSALHRAPAASATVRSTSPAVAARTATGRRSRTQNPDQASYKSQSGSVSSTVPTQGPAQTQGGPAATATTTVTPQVAAPSQPTPAPVAAAAATAAKPKAPVAQPQPIAAEPQPAVGKANVESDTRLEREMQMLAVAQRVLADDPARALRLVTQGEAEFPRSMFSAERTQISLLALVQLGHLEEARRLAAPFLRAYPNAPWTPRLREALASGRLPAP